MDKALLRSVLSKVAKAKDLQHEQPLTDLTKILNQEDILPFSEYLERSLIKPTIIFEIINQLYKNQTAREILGNKLLKLWLLFEIYQDADVMKQAGSKKREAIQQTFSQFNFTGSSLIKLITDCLESIDIDDQGLITGIQEEIVSKIGREAIDKLFRGQQNIEEGEQNQKRYGELLIDMIEDYQTLPTTQFLKTLQKELILAFSQLRPAVNSILIQSKPQFTNIESQINQLQQRYKQKMGAFSSYEINEAFIKIRNVGKDHLYDNIYSLKSKIMGINVFELRRLIGKTSQAQQLVKNKDVLFFIGNTRSGKSTNILKFLGYNLKVGTAYGLKTLVPTTPVQKLHETFYTSPEQKSCTRNINAVNIPDHMYQSIIKQSTKKIAICDSPGFGDSAGIQVDIANGIGMVNALHGAKSVRIVIILPFGALQANMADVIKVINIYATLCYSQQALKSTAVLFNKFPQEAIEETPKLFQNKLKNLTQIQNTDIRLVTILKHIEAQSRNKQNFVNPLNSDYKKILKRLIQMKPIYNVENFKYQFSYATKKQIQRYAQINKNKMKDLHSSQNYQRLQFHLKLFTILNNILKDNKQMKDYHQQILRLIHKSSQKQFNHYQTIINQIVNSQENKENKEYSKNKKGNEEKLRLMKQKITLSQQKVKQIFKYFNQFFKESQMKLADEQKMKKTIEEHKQKLQDRFQNVELANSATVNILKIFSQLFMPQLKSIYLTKLQKKHRQLMQTIKKQTKQKKYDQMKENIKQFDKLTNLINQIQEKGTPQTSNESLKKLKKPLLEQLQSAFQEFKTFRSSQTKINKLIINNINTKIHYIKSIESLKFLDKNNQYEIKLNAEKKAIHQRCKRSIFQLQKIILLIDKNDKKSSNQLLDKKNEVQLLMEIEGMKDDLKKDYQYALQNIRKKNQQNVQNLTKLIQSLRKQKSNEIYHKLNEIKTSSIIIYQCSQVIQSNTQGKKAVDSIQTQFIKFLQNQISLVKSFEVKLLQISQENIKKIQDYHNKINAYSQLAVIGDKILQTVRELQKQFIERLKIPFTDFRSSLVSFMKDNNHKKTLLYNLQKLQKLGYYVIKIEEIFDDSQGELQTFKQFSQQIKQFEPICESIKQEVHSFLHLEFDHRVLPEYLKQLTKTLLNINNKPYSSQFLTFKMHLQIQTHFNDINNKFRQFVSLMQKKLSQSQSNRVQFQEVLGCCKFYSEIEQIYKDQQQFGFSQLRKKYQQKFYKNLKEDEQKIKLIIIGYKPSKILFKELNKYYQQFKQMKNSQGALKRNLITTELNKIEQKILTDLRNYRCSIEEQTLANDKIRMNDFLETFTQAEILYRQLQLLYTHPEDKPKISISQNFLDKIKQQVVDYYYNQFNELRSLVENYDSVSIKQKFKAFNSIQVTIFSSFFSQGQLQENKSKILIELQDFIAEKGKLLKQEIKNNSSIKQQQKSKANKQKRLYQLILILFKGLQLQAQNKYECKNDNTNFVIDQGFRKYYTQTSSKIKVILNQNVKSHFSNLFKQYKNSYNTKDASATIKYSIEASICNLPKQLVHQYKSSFQFFQKKLISEYEDLIIKRADDLMKNPATMKDFINSVIESKQNRHIELYNKWVSKFNQVYTYKSQQALKVQEKIRLIQQYFIKVSIQHRESLKSDQNLLQIIRNKFGHQLNILRQEANKRLTLLAYLLANYTAIAKEKDISEEIMTIFKIYFLFISLEDNEVIKPNQQKRMFIRELQEKLNQCIIICNKNLQKKPNFKLDSEEIFDNAKYNQFKQYIHSIIQTGDLISQVQKELNNAKAIQAKHKVQSLIVKMAPITKYKPVIEACQHQFQQIRRFVSDYDFFGDIKRNMSSQQLEKDLEKLNIFYRILEEKQEQLVSLLYYQKKNNKYVFRDISRNIPEKFNAFARQVESQIKHIFDSLDGEPSYKINLLINELQIIKQSRKELFFIKKDKIKQTLDSIKNQSRLQFENAIKNCKNVFQQAKKTFKQTKTSLEALNEKEKKQINQIKQKFTAQLQAKRQDLSQKYNNLILAETNQFQKTRLKKESATEINSIETQNNQNKNEKIKQIESANKLLKNQYSQTLQKCPQEFAISLMILQKALIDIIYNVSNFKEIFDRIIQDIKKAGSAFVSSIQNVLASSEDPRSLGKFILSSHKTFSNFAINIINKLIKGQDINYVLGNLQKLTLKARQKMKEEQLKKIAKNYEIFALKYENIKRQYQKEPTETTINSLINPIKSLGNQLKEKSYHNSKPQKNPQKKVELLAGIFALWAILKSQVQDGRVTFTIEPHPTQITTLFLLLGIISPDQTLSNRLAQVGTGQGKSILLAGLSSFLSLVGYSVKCACYSAYLCGRDQQNFKQLFQKLGVDRSINYGTFNQLCQQILNSGDRNIKQQIQKMILSQKQFNKISIAFGMSFCDLKDKQSLNPTILVIDEVDVFFQNSFFGRSYCPGINLRGEEVTRVIEYVWKKVQQKGEKVAVEEIITSQVFDNLINKYPSLQKLLINQAHGMVSGAINYKHDYHIVDKRICYKDGDSISYKISYGYKTVFANIFQFNRGKVSQINLEQSLQISLMIAQFSYAQLPSYFQNILGVTGTLEVLPLYKKIQLQQKYSIKDQYAIPSAFGINKKRIERHIVTSQASYEQKIVSKINEVNDNRPIIIFFKGSIELNEFANADCYKPFLSRTNNLTEYHDASTRDSRIIRAVNPRNITLMSSAFGRGTDFILLDDKVKENGGLHVIQAFLSLDQSEELQIKGRTARQNSKGSYDCILSYDWLEELDIQPNEISQKASSSEIHDYLFAARQRRSKKLADSALKLLKEADQKHQQVFKIFTKAKLTQTDLVNYIQRLNYYPLLMPTVIKTVLGLDATISMKDALQKTCQIIGSAFQRSYAVLYKEKIKATIEIAIKIYRNYNSVFQKILQSTAFQSTPVNLKHFLQEVKPDGGWKNEAIQVVLQSINKEEKVSQVILIGDAPANTIQEVKIKRSRRGEEYWNAHGFPLTNINKELEILKERGCPVHSFYLNDGKGFIEISKITGGQASPFKIGSPSVANELTDFIVVNILNIVEKQCNSKNLVKTYKRIYVN